MDVLIQIETFRLSFCLPQETGGLVPIYTQITRSEKIIVSADLGCLVKVDWRNFVGVLMKRSLLNFSCLVNKYDSYKNNYLLN